MSKTLQALSQSAHYWQHLSTSAKSLTFGTLVPLPVHCPPSGFRLHESLDPNIPGPGSPHFCVLSETSLPTSGAVAGPSKNPRVPKRREVHSINVYPQPWNISKPQKANLVPTLDLNKQQSFQLFLVLGQEPKWAPKSRVPRESSGMCAGACMAGMLLYLCSPHAKLGGELSTRVYLLKPHNVMGVDELL